MSELPKGWTAAKIRDAVQDYETVDPKKTPGKSFLYVDIGAIDNSVQKITEPKEFLGKDAPSRARRVIAANDVLFSTVRTYLKNVAQVPESLDGQLTSTGISVLRANASTDPGYLFRWVCSSDFIAEISEAQDGTMYPAVRDEDVLNGPIALPPLPEQRRIVRKLDTLSARTTTASTHLNAIAKLVQRYKASVLTAGIAGELTADWRLANGVSGGELQPLDQHILEAKYGSSAKSRKAGRIPVLRMGNIQSMEIDWGDLVFTSDAEEIEKYGLEVGDVLFNRTNSPELVGKTAIYRGERPAIHAGYLIRLKCAPTLLPEYLNYALNSSVGRAYCWRVKSDSVSQSNVNAKKLKAFEFVVPSLEEQDEIVRRIKKAFDKIDLLTAEAEKALKLTDRLDQRILAKAFAGGLVPQDPNDEPASVLLDRIRTERASATKPKRGRKKKADA